MSDPTQQFLETVPLLEGFAPSELAELATVLRRLRVRPGEALWEQGDESRDMVFVVDGSLAATLRVPGGRDVEIARSGAGEMIGELSLLDGGVHTMRVHATEQSTVLVLNRGDFLTLLSRRVPSSYLLKRRLAALLVSRHRSQLQSLAASLGGAPPSPAPVAELEYCGPPDTTYLRRMATFHDFDSLALWGFLTSGSYARCPPGRRLVSEGATSDACYLTINGAIEKVLVRGDRRIRVGLAGPGKAFGYESLIDGEPSPITAITRERVLLLVLPREPFDKIYNGEDGVARVFLDVIQRDLVTTLRETLRPHARFAASF